MGRRKPLFKRSETWEDCKDDLRGSEGPLYVSKNRVNRDVVDSWLKASLTAGYNWTDDYNQENQEGVAYFQMTMKDGIRCSAATAYLTPVRNRKNLTVITRAHAEKIIIKNGRATAVSAIVQGQLKTIEAAREVIVCAGAVGSPQLLMLSGIGAPDELSQHGIEVVGVLPGVGKNMQDHLQARPVYKCKSRTINNESRNPIMLLQMAAQYVISRSGPMAMAASLGTGFLKTRPELETPDIQFHIQPFSADILRMALIGFLHLLLQFCNFAQRVWVSWS